MNYFDPASNDFFLNESTKVKYNMKKVRKIIDDYSNYTYGFMHNGKVITDCKDSDHPYRVMKVEDVKKYKCGTCWDMTNLIYNTKDIPGCILYYIEDPCIKMHPTHTWPVIYDGKYYYILETAWKSHVGIHQFKTEKDMLNKYIKLWKDSEEGKKADTYFVMRYDYFKPDNMTPTDFMINVYRHGKVVKRYGCESYLKAIKNI